MVTGEKESTGGSENLAVPAAPAAGEAKPTAGKTQWWTLLCMR